MLNSHPFSSLLAGSILAYSIPNSKYYQTIYEQIVCLDFILGWNIRIAETLKEKKSKMKIKTSLQLVFL